jgi:hypothetical protein
MGRDGGALFAEVNRRLLLVLFVALNEKKRIVATFQQYDEQTRQWE